MGDYKFCIHSLFNKMKFLNIALLAGSVSAFAPSPVSRQSSQALKAFDVENLPGALPPVGFFDPLGFAEKADANTLKRYREAEVTHGRVACSPALDSLSARKLRVLL